MYEQQILKILSDVGEQGISIGVLSKHVFNMTTSFFEPLDLREVHYEVHQYLLRNSKSPQSIIERTGKRGYYRLNIGNSSMARQLMLEFRDEAECPHDDDTVAPVDLSLNLFDD